MGKYELLALPDEALLAQCTRQVCRGTGPGGQKRNKTSSAVRLVHEASGIEARDDVSRSQHQNLAHALRRLRLLLAAQLPATPPPPEMPLPPLEPPPSAANPNHPLWVARLFDALQGNGYDTHATAAALGCSPSRLLRLLAREDAVWQLFCAQRQRLGLAPLRAP